MGLFSDPSLNRKNQLGRSLIKHNRKICIPLYFAGLIWFCCLGHPDFNHAAYFSENALSPGLVYSEIKTDSVKYAQSLLEELNRERVSYKTSVPYSWITAKMQQIGLDTYTHNFTLNYPFGGGKTFHGKNIYGILRAPRIGSTEGIVLSAPYRAPNSVHTEITASIPILLAFAEFARKKNYWAKDIIFLITDQEQLGMHAWLESYHKEGLDGNSALKSGVLQGRAGALQAALNIEIQDFDIDYIQVKVEGLNGQLPNLDMFNLVQRLANRENFPSSYRPLRRKRSSTSHQTIKENIFHMLSMVLNQATCVPTGNHGLFHRYRIESLTLEGVKRPSPSPQSRSMRAGSFLRTIEGVFRSLNNLLERFHQSYFFYLLVANDRFVSIGDFMPCLVLMAGPLLIKAFLLWLSLDEERVNAGEQKSNENATEEENKAEIKREEFKENVDWKYMSVGSIFVISLLLGLAACFLPASKPVNYIMTAYGFKTESIICTALAVVALIGVLMPIFVKLGTKGLELLHIATLLHLGCSLIVVGLLNFSLGFIVAAITSPLAILIDINHRTTLKSLTTFYTLLLHPLVIAYLIVLVMTLQSFPELSLERVAVKAVEASMNALTYAAVDSIIYGNWLFTVGTTVFFPSWTLFWIIGIAKRTEDISRKLKED